MSNGLGGNTVFQSCPLPLCFSFEKTCVLYTDPYESGGGFGFPPPLFFKYKKPILTMTERLCFGCDNSLYRFFTVSYYDENEVDIYCEVCHTIETLSLAS